MPGTTRIRMVELTHSLAMSILLPVLNCLILPDGFIDRLHLIPIVLASISKARCTTLITVAGLMRLACSCECSTSHLILLTGLNLQRFLHPEQGWFLGTTRIIRYGSAPEIGAGMKVGKPMKTVGNTGARDTAGLIPAIGKRAHATLPVRAVSLSYPAQASHQNALRYLSMCQQAPMM